MPDQLSNNILIKKNLKASQKITHFNTIEILKEEIIYYLFFILIKFVIEVDLNYYLSSINVFR